MRLTARDNGLRDSSFDDFGTLAAGKHVVTLQNKIVTLCNTCSGLGIFEIHNWVMSTDSAKRTN